MTSARPLRDVFADLAEHDPGGSPPDAAHVLAASGHPDLPDGLVAEAVVNYADTAPIEVAEHLQPYVMAHSPVPQSAAVYDADPGDWLHAVASAPVLPPGWPDVDPGYGYDPATAGHHDGHTDGDQDLHEFGHEHTLEAGHPGLVDDPGQHDVHVEHTLHPIDAPSAHVGFDPDPGYGFPPEQNSGDHSVATGPEGTGDHNAAPPQPFHHPGYDVGPASTTSFGDGYDPAQLDFGGGVAATHPPAFEAAPVDEPVTHHPPADQLEVADAPAHHEALFADHPVDDEPELDAHDPSHLDNHHPHG